MSSETVLFVSSTRPLVCLSRFLILFSRTAGSCSASRMEEDILPLCSQIMRQIQDALAAKPIVVHGSPISCTVEPSPERRARNSVIARAYGTLETFVPEGQSGHYRLDVRDGTAYYASCPTSDRRLTTIGSYSASGQNWTWRDAAFPKGWPVDLVALKEATANSLLE